MIPYGRQQIDEEDIEAVNKILRSDWLTTGPEVQAFENAVAEYSGAKNAIAVSNGTAALHCAMYAAGIGPEDEVIVPAITFVATSNSVIYQGGTPIFADVVPKNLLIDPSSVEERLSLRTKAIACVDYAGHPCDYDELRRITDDNELILIADSCHSLGATYKERKVGCLADMTVLSFHPVKHITTGEGGMVLTDSDELAEKMRRFRNHGIDKDAQSRNRNQTWYYEVVELGYNYRLTDIQCALGRSQIKKLPKWLSRRRSIAKEYDTAFKDVQGIDPLLADDNVRHAYHLYVARITGQNRNRDEIFIRLRQKGLGVNVHYIPVHLHPYYRNRYGTEPGLCPVAEQAFEHIISLPIYGSMEDENVSRVISNVKSVL